MFQATRIPILALVAAAVVALSGFPVQAQPYYYYGPPPPPAPYSPYGGAMCQAYSYNGVTYTNCPEQPYTYNQSPYGTPYYTPYSRYYYYGPDTPGAERER